MGGKHENTLLAALRHQHLIAVGFQNGEADGADVQHILQPQLARQLVQAIPANERQTKVTGTDPVTRSAERMLGNFPVIGELFKTDKLDEEGNPIVYTVVESWDNEDWIPTYGPVTTIAGQIPTYETTVTNTYRWTGSVELPGTGGMGTPIYILCGSALMFAPLVYGFRLRRRYGRRSKE